MHDTLLEMRNVTKSFPGVLALNNVNIELRKGEILGICGENGAGKINSYEGVKWELRVK